MRIIAYIILFLSSSFVANAASIPSYSYSEIYMYDNQECYNPDDQNFEGDHISDPFKLLNKQIFYFNAMLDTIIFVPANQIYTTLVPKRTRPYVANFMSNIAEPINLINSLLQRDFAQARITFGRFITNSLLGFFGIMDVARGFGLQYKGEDFGQTMAHYGVGSGPYLMVPIMGPSSARDLTGKVADYFMDPFKYALTTKEKEVVNITWILQKRAENDSVIRNIRQSLDPYETAKQMYMQFRKNQINSK